eukprot:CAMPEP_0196792980 /NCGR_PEP_ID=MMETSP1104-20130614/32250_1 /TAXON_ID=33652 /ORGANISM="Cafeteria sp., Strain Caron Lab Isolate" /LENGTH=198 /DNA_ID=CAMNT_0042163347 /DNA_START=42 /DNA_END=638 /DNA_ORIENTATION=+
MYEKPHTGRTVQTLAEEEGTAPAQAAPPLAAPDAASITTFHDFDKYWRRSCTSTTQRFDFLIRFPPKRLARIFSQHPDALLLSAILEAYASSLLSKHKKKCSRAAQQLTLLLASPLMVDFLTSSDLPHVRTLEATLGDAEGMTDSVRSAALEQLRAAGGKIEAAMAKAQAAAAAESGGSGARGGRVRDDWDDLSEDDL